MFRLKSVHKLQRSGSNSRLLSTASCRRSTATTHSTFSVKTNSQNSSTKKNVDFSINPSAMKWRLPENGLLFYKIYRALTYTLSPIVHLHLRWRKLSGIEHPTRWPERLGRASLPRPPGPLVWFHAVSLGEGMAAIPVIKQCIHRRPDLNILMTTTTASAFKVLENDIPNGVLYQFCPVDTPAAMDAFLSYWNPTAVILLESELWPNLIMSSSAKGIPLALLNARMSRKSFKFWSGLALPLISLMLSKFSLIVPLSTTQAIHYQLLQAPPFVINFAGDLKYGMPVVIILVEQKAAKKNSTSTDDLKEQLSNRHVWMAASIHRGEEQVMLAVHASLVRRYPDLLTIVVPRHPQHARELVERLQKEGHHVVLRSSKTKITVRDAIYVVDTLGELRHLYSLTPIAVIGGSFHPGFAGHNISEAAAAGCAVLTGVHVGHFAHMISQMRQLDPWSIVQVSGKAELEEALIELFNDATVLEARRRASKRALDALSSGVVANVWNLVNTHVLALERHGRRI
ncbi:Probable 3-deoxy-D-manno-octulosonic acid transferase, mitochondrial [Linum grandiflorum]